MVLPCRTSTTQCYLPDTSERAARPRPNPSPQADTRFTCPEWMEGWVDLGNPEVELATSRSQLRHPKHVVTPQNAPTYGDMHLPGPTAELTALPVRLRWLCSRDGNGSSLVTHDSRPMIITPFHPSMAIEGAWWCWTTLSVLEQSHRLKLSLLWKIRLGLIEWMSSFLTSTKNKKIASYCAVISLSWVNRSLAVTHDPRDPFPSLLCRPIADRTRKI